MAKSSARASVAERYRMVCKTAGVGFPCAVPSADRLVCSSGTYLRPEKAEAPRARKRRSWLPATSLLTTDTKTRHAE